MTRRGRSSGRRAIAPGSLRERRGQGSVTGLFPVLRVDGAPSSYRGRYAGALYAHPSVRALLEVARHAPALPPYDAALRSLGGDPDAMLYGTLMP